MKKEDERTSNRNFLDAWINAINGIIYATTTQGNVKKQLIIIVVTLLFSLFFNLTKVEFLCLLFSVVLIIITEMINTGIETAVDLYTDLYHPKAKIAKDVGAGAVVIASINAVVVSYFLFFDKIAIVGETVLESLIKTPEHLAFTTVALTLIAMIALKATNIITKKRNITRRFRPSGIAAISFMATTILWFITKNMIVFTLAILLAILACGCRVESKARTWGEIFFGGFIGFSIAMVMYGLTFII